MNQRVLLVDDDQRVLDGFRRTLHSQFEIATALSGQAGLKQAETDGPFAVIVSDYQMPEMNGVQFLTTVKDTSPDSVRVMLTGQADMEATIAAINRSDIFRFLSKPCPPEVLAATLRAGVEQYRLIHAERELLEQTLARSAEVLIDVLGLVDPGTHRISAQVRDRVTQLARALRLDNMWELELAATLSQLGTVGLPTHIVERHRSGAPLTPADQAMIDQHPQSAHNLLAKIPRLERVGKMILTQAQPPGNRPLRTTDPGNDDTVAIGAHLLDIVLAYERLTASGLTPQEAVDWLRRQPGPLFRTRALDALEETVRETGQYVHKQIRLDELTPRMTLNQDVHTTRGTLLLTKGQELTQAHVERLKSFDATAGLTQPIDVLVAAPHATSNRPNM